MALSSTTARAARSNEKRTVDAILETDAQFLQGLKTFTSDSESVAGLAGGNAKNSPSAPAGNYLAREGDTMIGPIALGPPPDFRIEVDAANTINISPLDENQFYSSNVQLDSLQPNSSVLDIIAGANFDGQVLVLRSFAPTVPYTISQGTIGNGGNIQTPDSNDITFGDLQMLVLIFDASLIINANTGGTWRVLSGAGGGGAGGLQDPIILNENDLGTIGFLTQLIDWSTNNFYRAELNGDISISMQNLPPAGKWEQVIVEVTQDATGGHTVTFLDTFANGVTPVINPGAFSKTTMIFYAYNDGVNTILAFDVNSNFTEFPEFDHGTQGPAAINVDWGLSNFQRIILSGDITVTHTNLPSPGNFQQVVFEITQDLIGGHDVTYTQSFANGVVPTLNSTPTSKTTVVFYAYNTGVITILLAFDTTNQRAYIHAIKAADQPPPLTVGTPALFDTITSNLGLTVAAGVISGFKAGRTYECEAFLGIQDIIAASLGYCWVDVDNGALFIGSRGFTHTVDSPGLFQSSQPSAKAVFKPVLNTDTLELRFTTNTDLPGIFMLGSLPAQPESYIMIKEIN